MSDQIQDHILDRFEVINQLGRGAYGFVWKVVDKTTKQVYALKKIFDAFQHSTDAQRTYREIIYLDQLQHSNIIRLHNVIRAENNKDIYLVFQHMEIDLHCAIKENLLTERHRKYIIYQVAKAIKYLHSAQLIHRDIKPANILLNSECQAKMCDFGLIRSVQTRQQNMKSFTDYIATRWYRAPELVFGSTKYGKPIDIWSFGCLIAEMVKKNPLFAGNSTRDQIEKIVSFTGLPESEYLLQFSNSEIYPLLAELKLVGKRPFRDFIHCDSILQDLLKKMLRFDSIERITIQEILRHPYLEQFHNENDEPDCFKLIRSKIDDNRRLNLKDYRLLIYKEICNRYAKHRAVHKLDKIISPINSGIRKSSRNVVQEKRQKSMVHQREAKRHATEFEDVDYKISRTINKHKDSYSRSREKSIGSTNQMLKTISRNHRKASNSSNTHHNDLSALKKTSIAIQFPIQRKGKSIRQKNVYLLNKFLQTKKIQNQ